MMSFVKQKNKRYPKHLLEFPRPLSPVFISPVNNPKPKTKKSTRSQHAWEMVDLDLAIKLCKPWLTDDVDETDALDSFEAWRTMTRKRPGLGGRWASGPRGRTLHQDMAQQNVPRFF